MVYTKIFQRCIGLKKLNEIPIEHETLLSQRRFNPLTAGVAYIRVFIFISTLCTTF